MISCSGIYYTYMIHVPRRVLLIRNRLKKGIAVPRVANGARIVALKVQFLQEQAKE